MSVLAAIVFLSLTTIAAAHVAWGFGMNWPASSRDGLFRLVVGATRSNQMPSLPQCLVAAAAIFCAGLSALLAADLVKLPIPATLVTLLGVAVALVFAGRGVAPYTTTWRRRFGKEPFATMDRSWYGPFCLLVAAVFVALLIKRVIT